MHAAIYCRISKDKTGAGLGVERQELDCRELASRLGFEVVAVYADNDISAYSGKHRPSYAALLESVRAGTVDAVLVWHQDRLLRRATELEAYIEACEPRSVATHTVRAGTIDLSTPAGRAIARTLGAWAAYEVETSTARVKAAKLQAARAGKFSGGQRPYGYEPGCTAIREEEAAVVREMACRVIKGESFRSVAIDLNERQIFTTHMKRWNALNVRNLLLHKRYAGIREHHDAEYPAEWPAVLDLDTWDELQGAIVAHRRLYKQRGPARKYLMTGFAFCGSCGKRMNTAPKDGYGRYVCRRVNDVGVEDGCGKVHRKIEPVDHLITESILHRLESVHFATQLQKHQSDSPALKQLIKEHGAQAARLLEIEDDYATCKIDKASYERFTASGNERLASLRHQIDAASALHFTAGVPVGQQARAAWERNDIVWRRQVLGVLIEKVIIKPSNIVGMKKADFFAGKWCFRPEDIDIHWKV